MPKTKKTAKKKTVKKVVKKKPAKKTAKKKPVKKSAKPATQKKKSTTKKKIVAKKAAQKSKKKVAKKPAKTTIKKPTKKAAKKVVKKATTVKKSSKKPQKISKKSKTNMTEVEIKTKIETQAVAPEPIQVPSVPQPTTKEDKKLDTIMDDFEIEPVTSTPDDNYMNDTQLEYFRKILIRWKQQLMSEVDSTMGHMQEDGLSFPDPIDRAAQEEGFNLELRTRDRERKLIKKIESALDMIETRDYGYCEDCGADIGVRRLEARPTATKCIDCKTYAEIREKQSGG